MSNAAVNEALKGIVPAAQQSQRATGILASVTAAQCGLESGWLTHMPSGSNNCFGIKAEHLSDPGTYVEAMTTEFVHGKEEHEEQPFEKYATLGDCFVDHARLLSQAKRYAPAMAVKSDPAAFADELQKCGYSTSPTYSVQLVKIINEFDLTQYDLSPDSPAAAAAAAA